MVTGAQAERARQFWHEPRGAGAARLRRRPLHRDARLHPRRLAAAAPRRRGVRAGLRGRADRHRPAERRSASSTPPTCRGRSRPWPPPISVASGRASSTCRARPRTSSIGWAARLSSRGSSICCASSTAPGCRVIMDHHAVRDDGYRERFRRLWDTGRVVTAAGFLGLPDAALEARRRSLWTRAAQATGRRGEARVCRARAGSGAGASRSRRSSDRP